MFEINITKQLMHKLVEITEERFASKRNHPTEYARLVSLISILLMGIGTTIICLLLNGEIVFNIAEILINWTNKSYDMNFPHTFMDYILTVVASILVLLFTTEIVIPYLNITIKRNNPDSKYRLVTAANVFIVLFCITFIFLSLFLIFIAIFALFIFYLIAGNPGGSGSSNYEWWWWLDDKDLKW